MAPLDLTTHDVAVRCRLLEAARAGETALLVSAIDRGRSVELATATGDSLLILAAYHDHPETVAALLQRGADPGRTNDQGQSAFAAAAVRHSDLVRRELARHPAAGQDDRLADPGPVASALADLMAEPGQIMVEHS